MEGEDVGPVRPQQVFFCAVRLLFHQQAQAAVDLHLRALAGGPLGTHQVLSLGLHQCEGGILPPSVRQTSLPADLTGAAADQDEALRHTAQLGVLERPGGGVLQADNVPQFPVCLGPVDLAVRPVPRPHGESRRQGAQHGGRRQQHPQAAPQAWRAGAQRQHGQCRAACGREHKGGGVRQPGLAADEPDGEHDTEQYQYRCGCSEW